MKPPTTTYSHLQPLITTCNHPELSTVIHDILQLPSATDNAYNHPPTTTYKHSTNRLLSVKRGCKLFKIVGSRI